MAIINCPECNKQVSDQAYACPVCGFPIREHFDKIRYEEEKKQQIIAEQEAKEKLEKELEEKKNKYAQIKKFDVIGHSISFTINKKISAIVGNEFYLANKRLRVTIVDKIQDFKFANTMVSFDNFDDLWNFIRPIFAKPISDATFSLISELFGEEAVDEKQEELVPYYQCISYDKMIKDVEKSWDAASEVYAKNMRIEDEKYYEAMNYQHEPIVSAVFAPTVGDMIVGSIQARMINSFSDAMLYPFDALNKKLTSKEYATKSAREKIRFITKILGTVCSYFDSICAVYKEAFCNYLLDNNELFEKVDYPVGNYDTNTHISEFTFLDKTTKDKKIMFLSMLPKDPANPYLYGDALVSINFNEDELGEIDKILDYLNMKSIVLNVVNQGNDDRCKHLCKWLEGTLESAQYASFLQKCSIMRTCDEIVFNTVKEKDTYIIEKKANQKAFGDFYKFGLNDVEKLRKEYNRIKENGSPSSLKWKGIYDRIIEDGKRLLDELDNCSDLNYIQEILRSIDNYSFEENKIHIYTVEEVLKVEDRKSLFGNYSTCTDYEPSEIPFVKIAGTIISSAAAFYSTKESYSLRFGTDYFRNRFTLNDIQKVDFNSEGDVIISYSYGSSLKMYEEVFEKKRNGNEAFRYVAGIVKRIVESKDFQASRKEKIKEHLHLKKSQIDEAIKQKVGGIHIAPENIDFTLRFRTLLKGLFVKINKSYLLTKMGYDFDQETYGKMISDKLKESYTVSGEYILYCRGNLFLTDRHLYLGNSKFELKNITKLYYMEKVGSLIGTIKGSYTGNHELVMVFEENNYTPIYVHVEKYDIRDIEAIIFKAREPEKAIPSIHGTVRWCNNCNSFNVGYSLMKGKCSNCGCEESIYGYQFAGQDRYDFENKFRENSAKILEEISAEYPDILSEQIFEDELIFKELLDEYGLVQTEDEGNNENDSSSRNMDKSEITHNIDDTSETCTSTDQVIADDLLEKNAGEGTNPGHDKTACPFCGKQIKSDSKFCNFCGKTIRQENNVGRICPSCGNNIKTDAKFCNYCGSKLD